MTNKSKPCAMIKREFKSNPNGTIYCACCGEWQMIGTRIMRFRSEVSA
jgi:hypothetical protein